MKERLKVGVIGTGVMGKEHARVYKELSNVELVGVFDLDFKQAQRVAKNLKTTFFAKVDDLLTKVQAVSICTPTHTHFDVTKQAIDNKIHCLVEKPFTNNIDEGRKLIDLAKKEKVCLTVGHIERFNPVIKKLKDYIKKQKIISINITRVGPIPPRVKDVGIILDLGAHDIDLISYLGGSKFSQVYSVSNNYDVGLEGSAVMGFKLENGTIASVVTNWFTPYKLRKIEIALMDKLLIGDLLKQQIQEFSSYKEGGFVTKNLAITQAEPLKEELKNFTQAIAAKKELVVKPEEALKVVEVALTCSQK